MLTILYLHQYFNTPNMAGSTRSYEMARRFVAQGHEVHMITSWREHSENHDWFVERIDGIHVHWLPVEYSNEMSFRERTRAFVKFSYKAAIKASSIPGDVVFATSTPLTIALPAIYASKRQKIRMIFEVRDLWPELPIAMGALENPIYRFLAKRLELFAYKNAASIVALSPGMKEGVVRTGYPSEKVAVIPNSCDIDMFKVDSALGDSFRLSRGWQDNRPLLVYTGTFGLINGVNYLVQIACELQKLDSDIRILVIGNGVEFVTVTEQAKNSGVLNKNFYIERSLPKRDIPAALKSATVACALFVDKREMHPNSANKFFDALAAGKPVMINYGGWMHHLVKMRNCGLAMWKMPVQEVAVELDKKMHDTQWLENTSKASMKLAVEFFDRDLLANQLISVIHETVKGYPDKSESIATGIYL